MIVCVAVVGQENNPLFLHVLDEDEPSPSRFDFLIYSCLDALDAKLREQDQRNLALEQQKQAAKAAGAPPPSDAKQPPFLGLVTVTPEHQVYAFATTTCTKILVVLSSSPSSVPPLTTDAVSQKCEDMYKAYSRAISNPFYTPGAALESQKFTHDVVRIARTEATPVAAPAVDMAASSMF